MIVTFTAEGSNVQAEITENFLMSDLSTTTWSASITEDTVDVFIAEGYTIGNVKVYLWEYADAEARLAATGFSASQIGFAAKQSDDDSLWLLTNHDPITWKPWGIGDMQKSEYDADNDGIADEAESVHGGFF